MFHLVKYFIIVNCLFALIGVFAIVLKKQILNNVKFSLTILRLFLVFSFLIPLFVSNLNFDIIKQEIKISENVEFINRDGYKIDSLNVNKQEVKSLQTIQEEVERFNYINFIGIIFITVFALGNTKFILNFYHLRKFLKKSYVLKNYKNVKILTNENCKSPFSTIVRGKLEIVIPQNLYLSKERKVILHHEITHHRNKDTYWTLFEDYVVCAFFINVIFRKFRDFVKIIEEVNCDLEASSKNVNGYCISLARVYEELIDTEIQSHFVCTNTFAFNSEITKFRIEKLLSEKEKIKMKVLILAILVLICTSLGVAFGVSKVSSYEKDFDKEILTDVKIVAKDHLKKLNAKSVNVAVYDIVKNKIVAGIYVSQKEESFSKVFKEKIHLASTIKPVIIAKALDLDVISENEIFDTGNGKLISNKRTYYDWKSEGFGKISIREIIAQSSNIGSILIAKKINKDVLYKFLQNEQIDVVNSDAIEDIANGAAHATTTVDNLAKIYGHFSDNGKYKNETKTIIFSFLGEVVSNGTGQPAKSSKYQLIGKTGTNILSDESKTGKAMFVGLTSQTNPKYALSIVVDIAKEKAHGGEVAGPIFKDIAEKILDRENSKK